MSTFSIPEPRKAEKRRVKLKMAIQGPSGSGKTWGALALVKNLWPDAKVCVIDTENESSSLYADHFEFDLITLGPPFHTDKYIAAIDVAIKGGYDVVIIDSISHQWDGEGGILRRKEELDKRPGANSWTNWAMFTPEHTRFKEKLVQAPIHIIATMRSKQDYILEQTEKGKSKPVKVGMAPVQREGFDYEFSLVFDVQMDHRATTDKNRTGLFDGEVVNLADPRVAERLGAWLNSGKEAPVPAPDTDRVTEPANPPSSKGQKSSPWYYENGILTCSPLNAEERKSKKGELFVIVKLNGVCEGKNSAFCFHASMFDLLKASIRKTCRFKVDFNGNYLLLNDVLAIDGREYADGKPVDEQLPLAVSDPLEITDDDIPF